MKHLLILISISLLTVLTLSAQADVQKKAYSDYKPCTECFEQWKVTEGQASAYNNDNSPAYTNRTGRTRKLFNETYVGQTLNNSVRVIVGSVLMIATAVILTKATKPTIQ